MVIAARLLRRHLREERLALSVAKSLIIVNLGSFTLIDATDKLQVC